MKDFLGKIFGPFAFKLTFYALLLQKNVLSSIIFLQWITIKEMFSKLWSFQQVGLQKPFSEGRSLLSPLVVLALGGSILVLIFPPKTKAIAVPRHNPSMKRSQKYLWRPSGLGLAGERMKDSNRLKGILKLAEDTRHMSMVMGSLGNWIKD